MEMCLINAFEILTRTAYTDILLDFRMEVTQQLITGYRGRKRGHSEQDDLDTLHIFGKLKHPRSTW